MAYKEKWHHGALVGIIEISEPYNLEQICPHGWAEVKTETSFTNFVAASLLNDWYAPQTITIRCAGPDPKTAPNPPTAPSAPAASLLTKPKNDQDEPKVQTTQKA